MPPNPRLAFLSQEPPPNYVAGIGRGATGFTTRADLGAGPVVLSNQEIHAALNKDGTAAGEANGGGGGSGEADEQDDGRFQDPDSEVALFSGGPYDRDDAEADRAYDLIEMRRRRRRKGEDEHEEQEEEQVVKYDSNGRALPSIPEQFKELKRGLSAVTADEWANLPEVGDITRKNKRARIAARSERFYAIPDSIIAGAQASTQVENSIDASNGVATTVPGGASSTSAAKDRLLGMKLDQASKIGTGSGTATSIDPKGYLTGLNTQVLQSTDQISDVKKARLLLNSVTQTNPKHAPGWIAAARLEEVSGRQVQARQIIAKGCENCPRNEDVWLESVRLNSRDNAKRILAQAVTHLPESVAIWVQAMKLEESEATKRRVIRRALEFVPTSVRLWKEAVSLESDPEDAKLLLARAVELIPQSIELWLALARLESYDNARKVLNKARATIRNSYEIWVAAVRLEEQRGNDDRLDVIVGRAVQELQRYGGMLSREQWLDEAYKNERDGGVGTAQALVRGTIALGLDKEDDKGAQWLEDAANSQAEDCPHCARAIFEVAVAQLPQQWHIWRKYAEFEKSQSGKQRLFDVLERGATANPRAVVLWLMYAKERWVGGDVAGAREVLGRGFEHNPDSEDIWLAAAKLEVENDEIAQAREYLDKARHFNPTERIYIRSAVVARQYADGDDYTPALRLCDEGLRRYARSEKLWLIKAQILERMHDVANAREAYAQGVKACRASVPLWLGSSRLEERDGKITRARAVLDRARLAVAAEPRLWLEAVHLEERSHNAAQGQVLLAAALRACPASGLLWAALIAREIRTKRLPRATEALKKCDAATDAPLLRCVAQCFAADGKTQKAHAWFARAIKADLDDGDSWGYYLKFLVAEASKTNAGQSIAGSKAEVVAMPNLLEDGPAAAGADNAADEAAPRAGSEDAKDRTPARSDPIDVLAEQWLKAAPKHGIQWAAFQKRDAVARRGLRGDGEKLAAWRDFGKELPDLGKPPNAGAA